MGESEIYENLKLICKKNANLRSRHFLNEKTNKH